MGRPAPHAGRSFIASIALVLLLLLVTTAALAGGAPRNVLVVENSLSSASTDIAAYYMAARGIPTSNLCRIQCSTSEIVTPTEFETNIRAPILNFLQTSPVANQIDYIVLTKGVPLAANYGYSSGPLSITSILTCVGEPSVTEYMDNPYGPTALYPTEAAFSHQLDLIGYDESVYHLYLVTRLDAYTVQDVRTMIDRGIAASPLGPILLDATSGSGLLDLRLLDAKNILLPRSIPTIFDNTSVFLSNHTGLMGYFSWGSNDGSYTHAAYASNTFVPGSIADTFVSSSGSTFNRTSNGLSLYGQSLVADLTSQGACGVNGFVSEPYQAYATYPRILFDRYTKGYNLAESFYAATPMLFWKSVVIGDPLMAPYATVPQVTAEFPQNPLTGSATLAATAVDPDGIARVDFYLDGKKVGSCASEPYSIQVDTTQNYVGTHTVNVAAVEAGPVASEGWTSASVAIVNPVSVLRVISDALPCADEQGLQCTEKIVTAATVAMGGTEFYVQEADRSSGIRVISTTPVTEGDLVNIAGAVVTDSGERSIRADTVQIGQRLLTPLKPVGMPIKWIGGGDFGANTKGVTGGKGLRNIGLLVTTCGTTTYIGGVGEDFFYIDDGSRLNDGSGYVGLKVKCRNLTKPALGAKVRITGISSCEDKGSRVIPMVKVRKQSDIRVVT